MFLMQHPAAIVVAYCHYNYSQRQKVFIVPAMIAAIKSMNRKFRPLPIWLANL